MAKETADQESARHKKYYDQKFKCMQIVPGDLVLVQVKAFGPDHKIANRLEQSRTKSCPNTRIHLCTGYKQSIIIVMEVYVHYTGICCSHFNHSMKMELNKMLH